MAESADDSSGTATDGQDGETRSATGSDVEGQEDAAAAGAAAASASSSDGDSAVTASELDAIEHELEAIERELSALQMPSDSDFVGIEDALF